MKVNEGRIDRVARLVLAMVAVALPLSGTVGGAWAVLLYVVAAVLLVTAVVGYCPLYGVLGWRTGGKVTPGA